MNDAGKGRYYLFCGGGTGGHLYPALAIIEQLRRRDPDGRIEVWGTTRPIDEVVCRQAGIELVAQPVQPFRLTPWKWPGFWQAWRASRAQARRQFARRRPDVVMGAGGYASGPAIVEARRWGIPTALLNPDVLVGRANRHLVSKVDRFFVQFEQTREHLPGVAALRVTGCPVRKALFRVDRRRARERLGLHPDRHTLLVTGASQGAHNLNQMMIHLLSEWLDESPLREWQALHLSGAQDLPTVQQTYANRWPGSVVLPYTHDMPEALAAADLVVSRAGASTLAELTAVGRASILFPYPYDRARHQAANAGTLSDCGAAVVLADTTQPARNAESLLDALRSLLSDPEKLATMSEAARTLGRPHAAEQIADELIRLAAGVPPNQL
jgi:UDP-N-acetylglucosamine--N-acetylmuramyl-(pentapeptide) pyrophosphoryl-undecaprenol N-acetylglucosamine transferase